MFKKILVRSVLAVLAAASAANAQNVPGQPAELPHYQEGDGRNNQDQSGDINGPQDRGGVYEVGPNQTNPYEPNPYEPNPYQPGRPSRPRPGRPGHGGPGYPNQGYNEIKSVYIGRAVYNESLPLRELAGLDRSYAGSEVVSIRANTQPNSPSRTVVQLIADGRVVAQQINPGYQINIIPNQRLILGQNVRSLQLVINGSTVIQQIDIEINRNADIGQPYPGPGPGPITPPPYNPPYNPPAYGEQRINININRATYGDDRIDLGQYVDLRSYTGYTVAQVIVTATPQYESAFIDLLVNSFNQGQLSFNGAYSQQQTLWLQNRLVIGQGADSLVLYTRGNMTVDQVTLVLNR